MSINNGSSSQGHATMTGPGRTGGGGGAPGDLTAVQSGDAGIVVTSGTGPIPIISQVIAAEWPIANMRVYAVDFVNGLDTNAGFADAAGVTAGDYATACAAAGAVAKKTFAGLGAIFPRVGNGRLCEIIIRNGGVNTEQAYTDTLQTFSDGIVGYGGFQIRGTGTNTTAGAVAFAGTSNDLDYQGGITATGCNAPGYNPIAAFSTSVIVCLKVGGGAAAIPVEPAAPLGWRIRFDNATTTAALRNVCRQVAQVTGTDTVTTQTVLPAVPVGTDIFYLEQAGIAYPASTLSGAATWLNLTKAKISGLRCTGTLSLRDVEYRFTFCGCNVLTVAAGGSNDYSIAQTFVHPILGTRTVGGGLRAEAASSAVSCSSSIGGGLVIASTFSLLNPIGAFVIGNGSFLTGLTVNNYIHSAGTTTNSVPDIGAPSTIPLAAPRIVGTGRFRAISSQTTLGVLSITGAGAGPAITIEGRCIVAFNGVVSGATGNTDVGMDLTLSRGSLILLTTPPTVTGTLGDVRLPNGIIVTWAQLAVTGYHDSNGNKIMGTNAVSAVSITQFAGSIIGAVGAVVSYLADTGPIAANQIVPLRRPTSLRLATRLRVTNLVNTSANAVTVTLYQNGVATLMQVTIPAATAANVKFSDLAHQILFADGDDYDLRMDDAADVAGVVTVSAALEWAV